MPSKRAASGANAPAKEPIMAPKDAARVEKPQKAKKVKKAKNTSTAASQHGPCWDDEFWCANQGKDWTIEDQAILWNHRKVEGQCLSYAEIQKKLLRSRLALRLKVYVIARSNNAELAAMRDRAGVVDTTEEDSAEDLGDESEEAAEKGPEGATDGAGIDAILQADAILQQSRAEEMAPPTELPVRSTTPRVDTPQIGTAYFTSDQERPRKRSDVHKLCD